MKISLDWLRDYVAWEGDAPELAHRLTMAGLNVEGIEEYAVSLPGVVVAHVRQTAPHPQADKLTLCTVWDGGQELSVVCGAPNVRADQKVLLARAGAVLPGGLKIRVSRIRGVESQGMICSARELGLGGEAGGIMELPAAAPPGTPADALYGFRDQVLDVEVTPNRPDWLCHYGVAREIAALTRGVLGVPALWTPPKTGNERLEWSVEIESFADCPRYTAHLARGVKIGPAPDVIRNRLLAVGLRPINNVVDITNYVMLELGQPLHAFDRGKLSGTRLTVRRAAAGSEFAALDGKTYRLSEGHLVIADSAGPVALAGIMGGSRTEVDEGTQDVLLESAFFDPLVVRRGARGLGLVTDSSYRFEREADWHMVEKAAQRALHLLQQHAGARIVPERADRQNPDRESQPAIPLRIAQVNRLLGTELETAEAVGLLQALDLTVVPLGQARNRKSGSANLMVEVPSFRRDLRAEVDLIEEIARIRGYDKLPDDRPVVTGRAVARRPLDAARERIRRYLSAVGYAEIVTSSFMARDDLERLGLPADDPRRDCLAVRNPHHGGETLLRTTLLPSLLHALRHNLNADLEPPLRLFQVHRAYLRGEGERDEKSRPEEAQLPREPLVLQLAIGGRDDAGDAGAPAGLLEIKGTLQALADLLGWPLSAVPADVEPHGVAGRQWRLESPAAGPVGWAGEVAAPVRAAFGIEGAVHVAEVDLSRLPAARARLAAMPFSRFPAVKRDLSLLVPAGVAYAAVEDVVREQAGELLESVELFDFYRGKGVAAGAAALGIRLKFRSAKGTLKGTTVDRSLAQVTDALAARLDVRLRA